jgi:glycine oxidase
VLYATGHYRNGILLSPVTADAIAALAADGVELDVIAPFRPSRLVSA